MSVDYTKEKEYRKLLLNNPDSFYSLLLEAEKKYKEVFNEDPFVWGDAVKRLCEIEYSIEKKVIMGDSFSLLY